MSCRSVKLRIEPKTHHRFHSKPATHNYPESAIDSDASTTFERPLPGNVNFRPCLGLYDACPQLQACQESAELSGQASYNPKQLQTIA